eukprot:184659_1
MLSTTSRRPLLTDKPSKSSNLSTTLTNMNSEEIRKKLRHFFHSNLFHYLLAILIVVDLAIVLLDIILILIYCDEIPHDIEEAIHELVYVSISILGVFLIELSLQMYAFGIKEWASECLHVFDFIIVSTTFILEIVMHGNERVESMVGLLIVFRLWRLVRVIHVTTEALDLQHESELHELKEKCKHLQQQLEKLIDTPKSPNGNVHDSEKQKLIGRHS